MSHLVSCVPNRTTLQRADYVPLCQYRARLLTLSIAASRALRLKLAAPQPLNSSTSPLPRVTSADATFISLESLSIHPAYYAPLRQPSCDGGFETCHDCRNPRISHERGCPSPSCYFLSWVAPVSHTWTVLVVVLLFCAQVRIGHTSSHTITSNANIEM